MNQINQNVTQGKKKLPLRMLVSVAMLSGLAYVLSYFETSIPFFPPFLKMDLSNFPALIIAFAFGPLAGVMVELIKNLLGLLTTSTGGIGELANFIVGASMAYVAGFIYQLNKTRKGAIWGLAVGTIVKGIMGAVTNYFILLPLYSVFMPLDELIQSFSSIMPFIDSKLDVVLFSIFPFNLLKGLIISLVTLAMYKRVSPLFKDTH